MILACNDCGTVQQVCRGWGNGNFACLTCGNLISRVRANPIDRPLALSLATLALLIPANSMTLLHISILGMGRTSYLASGIIGLARQGWVALAIVAGLQGILLPFLRFGLLAISLAAIRRDPPSPWAGRTFRWAEELEQWAMPEVFLIGTAVGYGRLAPVLPVVIGWGGWALIAAAACAMLTRVSLDRRMIWDRIRGAEELPRGPVIGCTRCELVLPAAMEGQTCPRCQAKLWRRLPSSLLRATAMIVAGFALYPVANYFPMNTQLQLLRVTNYTIIDGIDLLLSAGFWPLAALIFTTSIAIPFLKLCGMTWLIYSAHNHSRQQLRLKTRVYRVIAEIGRWSNVDIFTIATLLPLMQFGSFLSVNAGKGAPAFLAVVVLTMLAVRSFDPRLLWDGKGDADGRV